MNPVIFIIFMFVALLSIVFVIIEVFRNPSLKHVFFGIVSVILGLMVGTLLAEPVSKLPSFWGEYLPLVVSSVFAISGLMLYRKMIPAIDHWLDNLVKMLGLSTFFASVGGNQHKSLANDILIDTSALIDSRVVEVARLGFLPQKVLVPRFILVELQKIADAKDATRRNKGKRGLEAVEKLREVKGPLFAVLDDDYLEIPEVDLKLVALAKHQHFQLLTTDYNLNKVAKVEGVRVLNINELVQGLRPQLLPGELLSVKIVHLGKDKSQGVGYLEDGTMIVVENAGNLLENVVDVKVTRSLQTAAGKMFFAKLRRLK